MALSTFGAGAYPTLSILTATSSAKTPGATNNYHALTGNSLTLTAGSWMLFGSGNFSNGGTTPLYSDVGIGWYGANGADTSTPPAALSTAVTTQNSVNFAGYTPFMSIVSSGGIILPTSNYIVTVSTTATVYLVTWSQQTTSANARITVYANAYRVA